MVDIGIIGLPQSGRTTVFNALAKGEANTRGMASHTRIIRVHDPRLEALADMFHAKKIVPAEVTYHDVGASTKSLVREMGISGQLLSQLSNVDAIINANKKVNRALKAGAMAVGAEVEINDIPGYMPYKHHESLVNILKENCIEVVGENRVEVGTHSTGSTDMGDISCIMPTSSIGMGGVTGQGHGRTYKFVDKELEFVVPAKVLALTCIDLLYDNAVKAKEIIKNFEVAIDPNEYTKFMYKLIS